MNIPVWVNDNNQETASHFEPFTNSFAITVRKKKLRQAKIDVLTSTFGRTPEEAGNDRDGSRPERERERTRDRPTNKR